MSTSAPASGGDSRKPAASADGTAAAADPPIGAAHTVPLIVVGTEEHGPFVPPKPEEIHAVKPALKKHPSISGEVIMKDAGAEGDDEGGADDDDEQQQQHQHQAKKKKALKWDEHAIEEHDLLRGTRMKIDEPKTPYAHYEHQSDDDSSRQHPRTPPSEDQAAHHGDRSSIDHGILERKLAGVAAVREFYPSSPSASSRDGGSVYSDEEATKKKRQHDREFKMHRKQHYNEMEMLRRFKAQHPGGLLDGEEDDDEDMEEG